MSEHPESSPRRQPLGDQFRSSDFAKAEEIRRESASETPTQQLAFVRLPPVGQDTSGSMRREALQRAEEAREAQRREDLRQHIASAITTRPVAVRSPEIHHQHGYQVVSGPSVVRYCDRCGAAWVLTHRGRYWSSSWQWERVSEE